VFATSFAACPLPLAFSLSPEFLMPQHNPKLKRSGCSYVSPTDVSAFDIKITYGKNVRGQIFDWQQCDKALFP
jgi:hypothetical protein